MISQISGKLKQKRANSVLIDVNGIFYEVLLPGVVMKKIDSSVKIEDDIALITYHYLQSDPSRSVPVLIGFLNDIEKEFFEKFITVSGVGPKAACRALELPFSTIADAKLLADGGVVVVEHGAKANLPDASGPLSLSREKTYGDTRLSLFT